MPSGQVRIWPASHCLMTQLMQDLETVPTSALPQLLIVVPTKRLCAWLVAALGQRRGSCVLPRLLTWEDFVRQEAGQVGAGLPRALWESLLLAELQRSQALLPGDEHEIAQLFADMRRVLLPGNPFAALAQVVEGFGIETGDIVQTRIEALNRLWQQWNKAAFTDAEAATAAMVEAAAAGIGRGRWSKLYLVGLTSAQKRDIPLLRACTADARTEVWLPDDPDAEPHSPLAELYQVAESCGRVMRMTDKTFLPPAPVKGTPLSSPLAEVLHAVESIHAELLAGTGAHHIGLALTDESLYGPLVREAVKTLPCPVNLAIATPLKKTRVGCWLHTLVSICRNPDDRKVRQSFLLHPVSRHGLKQEDERVFSYQNLARAFSKMKEEPLSSRWDALLLTFVGLERQALLQWWQAFGKLCATFRPAILGLKGQLDQVAGDAVFSFLQDHIDGLTQVSSHWPALQDVDMPVDTFLNLVESQLAKLSVRTTGDPFKGLQVMGIEELRFLPMAKVIVLGATEGLFPRSQPRDRLLDGRLKKQLGLPGWEAVEAIENTTFKLLSARLVDLTLSYPEQIARRETVRSRFLERLIGEKRAQFSVAEPKLSAIAKKQELPPTAAPTVAFDMGLLDQVHSTQAVEDLIACPTRFALRKWRVSDSNLFQLDDLRDEGEWLHAVLEAFFTGQHQNEQLAEDLAFPATEDSFLAYCQSRLEAITMALLPPAAEGASLHLQLKESSWPAFSRHLWQLWQGEVPSPGDRRIQKEMSYGRDEGLCVQVGQERLKLRLRIDSVDPFASGIMITDYKRRYTPPKSDVLSGLSPQLPLYAAALEASGHDLDHMLVGYFSILRGEWMGVAAGEAVQSIAQDRGLLTKRGASSLWDCLGQIGRLLGLRRQQLLQQRRWTADPSACGICRFQGICRRDDPRFQGELKEDLRTWQTVSTEVLS